MASVRETMIGMRPADPRTITSSQMSVAYSVCTDDEDEDLPLAVKRPVFYANTRLALSVAVWSALFAIPICQQRGLHYTMFGSRMLGSDVVNGTADDMICLNSVIKGQTFVVTQDDDGEPIFVLTPYDEETDGAWNPIVDPMILNATANATAHIWCGYIPENYEGYWPNVIQMMVFTVYCNTGSTINLAWQGLVGTLVATINASLMGLMFPLGGAGHECELAELTAGTCLAGEIVRTDPNFSSYAWIIWLDIFVVYLVVLMSGASENTMKWAMAWHSYFMMSFISPGFSDAKYFQMIGPIYWDSERMVVNLTTILGAILAILATLTPPVLNLKKVIDDSNAAIKAIDAIWSDSIDYVCGAGRTGKRFQIALKVGEFSAVGGRIGATLDMSWWESFDVARPGRQRSLLRLLDDHVTGVEVRHALYSVMSVVDKEDFSGEHNRFSTQMEPTMTKLKIETVQLLKNCEKAFEDGWLDESENADVGTQVTKVKDAQVEMLAAYMKLQPKVSKEFTNEYIFLFALSYWAEKMQEFGQSVADGAAEKTSNAGQNLIGSIVDGFKSTWSASTMFSHDRLSFAFRNWLTLSIVFILGYNCNHAIFSAYSSTMAGTLSLLISHFSGSALHKNLQRLLGVVLGKALPIIVLMLIQHFQCGAVRTCVQLLAILGFQFVFNYIYYSSTTYSCIGCLIAGFGCYPLLEYISCGEVQSSAGYSGKYKELGQVVIAILIQLLVDAIFVRHSARDKALDATEKLADEILEAYKAFFDGDVEGLRAHRDASIGYLTTAISLAPEVDPKMEVAPGSKSDFKYELYSQVLHNLKMYVSYLSVMLLACDGAEGDGDKIMGFLRQIPIFESMGADVGDTLGDSLSALVVLLTHNDESKIKNSHFSDIVHEMGISEIAGKSALYDTLQSQASEAEFNSHLKANGKLMGGWRVRISVLLATLQGSVENAADVNSQCIKANHHI